MQDSFKFIDLCFISRIIRKWSERMREMRIQKVDMLIEFQKIRIEALCEIKWNWFD